MCHSVNLIAEELVIKGREIKQCISIEKSSNYDKVIRALCYVRSFIYNCKAIVRKENCLTGNVRVLSHERRNELKPL